VVTNLLAWLMGACWGIKSTLLTGDQRSPMLVTMSLSKDAFLSLLRLIMQPLLKELGVLVPDKSAIVSVACIDVPALLLLLLPLLLQA
jgi:hypothetical protein